MAKRNIKSAVKAKNKAQNKAQRMKVEHRKQKKGGGGGGSGGKKPSANRDVDELRDRVFTSATAMIGVKKRPAIYDDDEDLDELREAKQPRKMLRKSGGDSDMDDDLEMNYQLKSLSLKKNKMVEKERVFELALPIKTREGAIMRNRVVKPNELGASEDGGDAQEEYQETKENGSVEVERPKTALDLIRQRKQHLEKTKEKIAHLSRHVIENPQEQTKKLKELRTMLSQPEIRSSNILKKMIVVSLCEVFKDICPSYKIRAWSSKENEQTATKEVKQLREYEETLVKQYKLYVDYLNETARNASKLALIANNEDDTAKRDAHLGLVVICVRCACQLFEKLFYFNFANDLIDLIVNQLTSKFIQVSELASNSIKDAFKNDKTLHLSLEITQKIAKLCRQKSFGVKSEVLNVFLWLKLTEINVPQEDKPKKLHQDKIRRLSRSERKKLKEKEKLEHDLEEKKVGDRLKEKANLQTRILEQLFAVYIKILKKTPNLKLIPCVLEGLCKFAHLINLDFFEDLLKLMHEMIESDTLAFRSKLHCIKTVFVVLSGQGEALTIDPVKFYTSLYNIIPKISAVHSLDDLKLLTECIEMMFIKRRKQVPTARLLAFIKRLSILTTQVEGEGVTLIIDLLKKLILLNKSCDLLFDNEYQDSGIYSPELPEPDYSNAQNSALWELHLLRRHCFNEAQESANTFLKESLKLSS